jgi:hypothetical protein
MPSKTQSSKSTKAIAPVVEKTETKKVEPVQKAGGKKEKTVEAKPTPVVETPVEAVAPKKGGAKKEAKATEAKKGGAKVAKAPKAPKVEATEDEPQVSKSGKVLRSFKVQLPGNTEFSGRFTGSTPYQAANKALSKYYRTTTNPKSTVTFVMRESTRGCKKNGAYPTYTYEGYRDFLPEPVSYTITDKDGKTNTIVKKHKNHLKKVKKADMSASHSATVSA